MNWTCLADIVSLLAVVAALPVLWRCWKRSQRCDAWWLVLGLLALTLFHDTSNVLEWSGITDILDNYEDYAGLVLPVMWFFLIFMFLKAQTDEALKKNEARLQSIFLTTPTGIGVVIDRVFEEVNEKICEMTGHSKEELIGQNARLLYVDDEEYERVGREKYGQIQDCGTGTVETRWQCKDGRVIDVLLSSTSMDPVDSSKGFTFTALDITERKRIEKERERLSVAIEQADETIVITDAKARIEYVNPAFERITGYTREEAIGENPSALQGTDHNDSFFEEMWEVLTRGETWRGVFINRKRDQTLYTEEAVISPVRNASGVIVNYVAVKRDITERIHLEERLLQAQKMEAVGRLAGGVAHDFNNLLMGIMNYVELCLEKLDPDHPVCEWLTEISHDAERSANLTGQLLAFARKQTIAPKVLDLNDTVSGMLKMLRHLSGETVKINWKPSADGWQVKMDPSQIDQILMNLCVNARDAIEGVGELTIETKNVTLDDAYCASHGEATPGEYVRLEVADNGKGMDQEVVAHIFEPFFTTKAVGEGTGLGLATIYGIVTQNKGTVEVRSEHGQGTTFTIFLPRTIDIAPEVPQPKDHTACPRGTETVLVAEDEKAIQKIVKAFLEASGYTVLVAETPAMALQFADEHKCEIELLITDVVMPGMSGRDLAEKISVVCPSMKVLYMSGYTADVIADQGILDANVNFISKPFTRDQLAQEVRRVLDTP